MTSEILPSPVSDKDFMDSLTDKVKRNLHKKYSYGEDLVKGVESEVAFTLKASDAFHKAVDSGAKKIHLLLDIDNTIGAYNMDFKEIEDRKFVIRPAFIKLIEELKKESLANHVEFDLGFISNREASHSQEQLQAGGQFQDFAQYVNQDLVFSSRHLRVSDKIGYENEDINDGRKKFLSKLGIVDQESPFFERLPEMNPDGYDKLQILGELAKSKQLDEAYIVVDDSPIYTEILDGEKGFYGIGLRDRGYFKTGI